jgi:hypothetical protein
MSQLRGGLLEPQPPPGRFFPHLGKVGSSLYTPYETRLNHDDNDLLATMVHKPERPKRSAIMTEQEPRRGQPQAELAPSHCKYVPIRRKAISVHWRNAP